MSSNGHQKATKPRSDRDVSAQKGKAAPQDKASSKEEAARKSDGPQSVAPGGSFTCTVNRAGPAENGSILVHLREASGKFDRWYTANNAVKKEMLATALTAISTGLRVSAFLTTTDEYGTLNRLYITR
jgi:hypothetical protein